jgi:hypothetical protein
MFLCHSTAEEKQCLTVLYYKNGSLYFSNFGLLHYISTTGVGQCVIALNRKRALQQEKSVNYSSVTKGKFITFLQQETGSASYFCNKSRTVHCGSEQEKGIAAGEVSALMLCKRRR